MAKILKNTTNSVVSIMDTGISVPASPGSYTIPPQDYGLWAASDHIVSKIGDGSLIVSDGSTDLSISDGTNLIKGIFPSKVKLDQPTDTDGRLISRPAAAKSGWTYFLCPVEFTTAKLNTVYCNKFDNTSRSGITYKIYDSNNAEITDSQYEPNAVKTVVDFEPTHDYEIIGGQLQQHTKPNTSIRLWVVGVPDVAEQYGGSKEMVGGVNLKFIDPTDKINADGRVSKYMTYSATYHTNKIRLILRHDAGIQHDVMMVFEMFKA